MTRPTSGRGRGSSPADRSPANPGLCFAIPSNSNGKWGVDIKPAYQNVSGNSWLTDDEVRILNGNLRGRQLAPESAPYHEGSQEQT